MSNKTITLTREDVDMIMKLRSEGIPLVSISRWVYNIRADTLLTEMNTWLRDQQIKGVTHE